MYAPRTVRIDEQVFELAEKTDKKILALWAIDCAKRVLPLFEKKYSNDDRPRIAIDTLKKWTKDGIFKMAIIRKASLDAHSAARDVLDDNAARSAARAAGQAVATAHVKTHSIAAASYALAAIRDNSKEPEKTIKEEADWQYQHLIKLQKR